MPELRPGQDAAIPPQANQIDRLGTRKRVLRVWQTACLNGAERQVQFMQFGRAGLRPLIWLHSIEYPMAPPWGLCVDAAERGFSIVSVRRPGFGETSPAEETDEEVRLLSAFLDEAGFEDAVMIAEGTSRPAGIKLARTNPRIAFTLLARPAYFTGSFGDVDPWLRDLMLQTMQTYAGARLSLTAITQLGRRSGPKWMYENFLKIESDTRFIHNHDRDMDEAWACLTSIRADTFRRELRALEPDASLTDGALADFAGIGVIGADTPEVWREGFVAKSESLGLRTALLPGGSMFALYQDAGALLDLIEANTLPR